MAVVLALESLIKPPNTSPFTFPSAKTTIVKVEVKKMCMVATVVNDLEWKRLEYDEEALELIMTTTKNYSAPQPVKKSIYYHSRAINAKY